MHNMSRHAVAVAILSLAVTGSPIEAQTPPSAQELADLHARADVGEALAQAELGFLYNNGLGVPQDHVEAAGWYRRAAEQGHAIVQRELGFLYRRGLGVPQDDIEAHIWLNLAASQLAGKSREQTVAARDALARWMTPAELRDAQSRARALHATQPKIHSVVQDSPYQVDDWGIVMPRVLYSVPPGYTPKAMRERIAGTVELEVVVLPDGTVGEVRITRSLDSVFGLDDQAIKAARRWRFEPGTRFGQPVAVLVNLELFFNLE